ncbi:MAG: CPBP family intramembrane metalloprotease [Planctomycetes bacterium]|nr:CPBP family intramembrane metalloprotease [Planctomycetota bacterium]
MASCGTYQARFGSPAWPILGLVGGVVLALGYQLLAKTVWPYDQIKDSFHLAEGETVNLLLFSAIAIAAAFFEELYYRGLIYPVLRRWIGVVGAMAIVTIWFGAVHLFSYYRAPLAMLTVTSLGLMAVMLRQFSRSVVPAIAAHLAYNGTVVVVVWIAARLA